MSSNRIAGNVPEGSSSGVGNRLDDGSVDVDAFDLDFWGVVFVLVEGIGADPLVMVEFSVSAFLTSLKEWIGSKTSSDTSAALSPLSLRGSCFLS